MLKILFTVTNELNYDQRMHRIAGSLTTAGYEVLLVGRCKKGSIPLQQQVFQQKRLYCFFEKGMLFYAEYTIRLFFFLLYRRTDCICAVDLDTILPCYAVSKIRGRQRIYDAHELFTEQQELIRRPFIRKLWLVIERFAVPRFKSGYTVNDFIAAELKRRYHVEYAVIRNLPVFSQSLPVQEYPVEKYFLYQGSVNEGRCFETLVPAMQQVEAKLVICGEGNFFKQVCELTRTYGTEEKTDMRGYVLPGRLKQITTNAYAGITLFESTGLNQYQSLANRFFDYMMAGIPQLCVNYPEYKKVNDAFGIAYLVNDTKTQTIADAMNKMLSDAVLYEQLRTNCHKAASVLNWENEEKELLHFYRSL
ncbi:MAG: glycosyltransferase [Sediminibacterium sp.]